MKGEDDDKNNYGDIDDRVVQFEPGVVADNDEKERTFRNVKGTLVMIGKGVIEKDSYVILNKQDFTIDFIPRERTRWKGNQFQCRYDPDYGGFEYAGYLVVLRNKQGQPVIIKASKSIWEQNLDAILNAKRLTGYDRTFKKRHDLYTTLGCLVVSVVCHILRALPCIALCMATVFRFYRSQLIIMAFFTDGIRITWVGLLVNLLLGVVKTCAGWWLGSKALIADGMHSLLDLLTDMAVLIGLSMAKKPGDETHHYGHHKFASLAKFFVGGVLLAFAGWLVASALWDFRSGVNAPQAGGAAIVAIVSLIIKEALFWWTRSIAKALKSDLLMANAWHHRTDSISSLGVAVALVGVWIGGENWAFLDAAVTLVLGCYLVFEAVKVFSRACADLLDAAPEQAIIEDFREHILATPGALAYHDFRVRRVGDVFEVDLHLQVAPELSVEKGHEIAKDVKNRLQQKHPEVSTVLVHVEPANKEHVIDRGISDVDQSIDE